MEDAQFESVAAMLRAIAALLAENITEEEFMVDMWAHLKHFHNECIRK